MKRVLLVATIPLSLKVFSLNFMKFLREKGYRVEAAAGRGREAKLIRQEGFRCHDLCKVRFTGRIDPISDLKFFISLLRLLRKEKFDLVHIQTPKAGFIGRLTARLAGVPVIVYTSHNWPFHDRLPRWRKRLYVFLEKLASPWCDAIIVDSNDVRNYGLKYRIVSPEKMHRIYMGVDLKRFRPYNTEAKKNIRNSLCIEPEKIVIGAIIHLNLYARHKGIDTLIACAGHFKDDDNVLFVVGGGGPLRKHFEEEVRQAGLTEKVEFVGHLDDVVPYLNAFDIFCLPTLREGFGVIFAEAQACGVPVVTSKIPVLEEVAEEGVSGFLVPPRDTEGFVEALKKLFDPELREQIGIKARRHIEENFRTWLARLPDGNIPESSCRDNDSEFKGEVPGSKTESTTETETTDLSSFYRELCALRHEFRKSFHRNHNSTTRFAETLEDFSGLMQQINRRLDQQDSARNQEELQSKRRLFLPLVDIYERFLRLQEHFEQSLPKKAFWQRLGRQFKELEEQRNKLAKGLEILEKHFLSLLEKEGVRRQICRGERFDPQTMRAAEVVNHPEIPADEVIEELSSGYLYHDQTLKLAEVVVSRKKEED